MWPLINIVFLNMAFTMLLVGFFINFFEKHLPLFIRQNFRYGKFAYSGSSDSALKLFSLPKSYFRHFYLVSTVLSVLALFTALNTYFVSFSAPSWIIAYLNFFCGEHRVPTNSPASTIIVLILITMQCFRRFYETFFVQVFASTSKFNISHYIVGHLHYFGCITAILAQSVGFTDKTETVSSAPFIDNFTLLSTLPTVSLFTFAWLNQYHTNVILANLRKDEESHEIISQKYFLPKRGWFQYVSCPHLLCEILIYISLTLLLFGNSHWLCIVAWVLSNQIETALLSHWWYKKTFPNYPKQRKALIPYIL